MTAKSQVWIAGALTAVGLAALALAFLWQDKGYRSSVLIEVGAATVLLVPLFLIQQRFERPGLPALFPRRSMPR
jgi:hypothetical protein